MWAGNAQLSRCMHWKVISTGPYSWCPR